MSDGRDPLGRFLLILAALAFASAVFTELTIANAHLNHIEQLLSARPL